MRKLFMNTKYALLILLPGLLVACNQDEKINSVISPLSIDQPDLHKADSHKAASGSIGKPHAPISMNYEFLNQVEINSELEIRLTFTLQQDSELLEVVYKPSENLKSVDAVQQQIFIKPEKGAEQSFVIRVVTDKGGLSYVNVFASITEQGRKQSRSFAIPVNIDLQKSDVDIAQQKSATDPTSDRKQQHIEQNVISMPAVESNQMRVLPKN